MREADHAHACGQKQQQPARAFFSVSAPGEPCEGERCEKSGDRAGQASGDLGCAIAEKFEEDCATPIEERRLFEPGFSVEAWRDPIATFRHIAGDPGEARLVAADDSNDPEMAEIADVKRDDDENGPSNALRGCRSGFTGRL